MDRSQESHTSPGEVVAHTRNEVRDIKGYVDKDIQDFQSRRSHINGHQARVAVVHKEVCAKTRCAEVVDAARTIRYVAEDDAFSCEATGMEKIVYVS